MQTYGKTDTGRVRPTNQDAYACGRLADDVVFAVVCDGMGGAKGGNVASTLAVKIITERLAAAYRENMTPQSIRYVLECAVAAANVEVFDTAAKDENLRGMGTTVVVAVVLGKTVVLAHIGDSRAYLVTEDGLEQVTRDHSLVQEMVESGKLTETEAKTHPRKHFITRALGVEDTVECDIDEREIPERGALLMCTDGLTNMVETDEIRKILLSFPPQTAAERLIHAANMAGGSDNITVALIA